MGGLPPLSYRGKERNTGWWSTGRAGFLEQGPLDRMLGWREAARAANQEENGEEISPHPHSTLSSPASVSQWPNQSGNQQEGSLGGGVRGISLLVAERRAGTVIGGKGKWMGKKQDDDDHDNGADGGKILGTRLIDHFLLRTESNLGFSKQSKT